MSTTNVKRLARDDACSSNAWACQMACMPIDTHAHASEDEHVGAGRTSMLDADMHAGM